MLRPFRKSKVCNQGDVVMEKDILGFQIAVFKARPGRPSPDNLSEMPGQTVRDRADGQHPPFRGVSGQLSGPAQRIEYAEKWNASQ